MHIELRPSNDEDEAFLLHLYTSTRNDVTTLGSLSEEQQSALMSLQFVAQRAAYGAQFPQADHQIVLVDGKPAGRLLVNRADDEIRLVDISLVEEQRNHGIGTDLLKDLQAEAQARRGRLTLHVVITNPAINLYRRLGFIATSTTGPHVRMEWQSQPAVAGSQTSDDRGSH